MILVYTNSSERAMLLATGIDGVVLRNKQKVRATNYDALRAQLLQELTTDGYIRTFFQGESCTFVYSEGRPCAPCKMAEYDDSYAKVENRPLPFYPDELRMRYVDETFKSRLPIYEKMCEDAAVIINAATDDIDGEISFEQFSTIFAGLRKKVFRARPRAMTESAIIEAFNALEDTFQRERYQSACYLHELMDWLVSCNATNALTAHNYEGQIIVAGRLESLVLTHLAERDKLRSREAYQAVVTLKAPDGTTVRANVMGGPYETEALAQAAADACVEAGRAAVDHVHHSQILSNVKLLNVFSAQAKSAQSALKLTGQQADEALTWLFHRGLITWPSPSTSLPWSAKPSLTEAITTLSKDPTFCEKVLPRDVDNFLDWDQFEALFGHTGILVTERPVPGNIPSRYRAVYDIIAAASIVSIKMKVLTTVDSTTFTCAGTQLLAMDSTEQYVPIQTVVREESRYPDGTQFEVINAMAVPDPAPEPYTEHVLINDILPILEGGFCFASWKIYRAIENLIAWGQAERDGDVICLTERGRLAYKYLSGTSLVDPSEVAVWDQRLLAAAQGLTDITSFESDLKNYIDDLCRELVDRANKIRDFGGKDASDLRCPVCGGSLAWPDTGGCKCVKCKFAIAAKVSGHPMSNLDIGELLINRRTSLIPGFISKSGKSYSARLVIDGQGRVSRSFLSPYNCPRCQRTMSEYDWGVKCTEQSCGFLLRTTVCGHRLSERELQSLVSGQITEPIHMTNSSGKRFVASLSLGDDGNVVFSFPGRKK